jgi:hypothetical protein
MFSFEVKAFSRVLKSFWMFKIKNLAIIEKWDFSLSAPVLVLLSTNKHYLLRG